METIEKEQIMIKRRIKHISFCLLFICLFFTNCKKVDLEDFGIFEFYQVFNNDRYNINVYLIEKYDKSKKLEENLISLDSIRCLTLIVDKKLYMKLRDPKSNNNFVLGKIKLELNKIIKDYPIENTQIKIGNKWIKCTYYLISDDFNSKSLDIKYYDDSYALQFVN